MRLTAIVGAAALLMSCGGTQSDNASQPGPGVSTKVVEVAGEPAQPANSTDQGPDVEAASVSACLVQGTEQLKVEPIRAVGTEPFWGARVEGRCVTYSTPDDQSGTRIWTRYSAGADGGNSWTGQLNGEKFEMRTRLEPGCSDGMSDKRYPIAVDLKIGSDERRGCAANI